MKTKYIAFSGTHGTGKSTQAYSLASQLKLQGKNVILLDELARECPLTINKCANIDSHLWILCAQIKRELELKGKYEYVICDRAVADSLAYSRVLSIPVDEKIFMQYSEDTYDRIFYMDHESYSFQINDGIRDLDPLFRNSVANKLLDLYHEWEVGYSFITEDSQIHKSIEEIDY